MGHESEIVLCIPGPWADRDSFSDAVRQLSGTAWAIDDNGLTNLSSHTRYGLEIEGRDRGMAESFAAAGLATRMPASFVEMIEGHATVAYLLSAQAGSTEVAAGMATAAATLVAAGGIGVKVETAGKACVGADWLEKSKTGRLGLYDLFVLDCIWDGLTVYSCGMRNLGLADAIVSGEVFEAGSNLLRQFNLYQLFEEPRIAERQTFSLSHEEPVFVLSRERRQPLEDEAFFRNPHGMWRLSHSGSVH